MNLDREVPITISSNLSGLELMELDKLVSIKSLCKREGFDPKQQILELTETAMVTPGSGAMDTLKEIRKLGFGLSIDDFGTGYSSLSYIEELPVTEIKIDRSFVNEIEISSSKRIIVEALIRIGNQLGIDIIAEGIETQRQCELLKELGCRYGQGYLFGHPMTGDQLLVKLAEDSARF